jgi:hypothetical protein
VASEILLYQQIATFFFLFVSLYRALAAGDLPVGQAFCFSREVTHVYHAQGSINADRLFVAPNSR